MRAGKILYKEEFKNLLQGFERLEFEILQSRMVKFLEERLVELKAENDGTTVQLNMTADQDVGSVIEERRL